jgi:hypothetical protein
MAIVGWLFSLVLIQSDSIGRTTATKMIVQSARVFTTQPISARTGQAVTLAGGTTGYLYDNLYFLMRGEDSYFMFDALDSVTCTPHEVLQIRAAQVYDVVYGEPRQIAQLCQTMFPTTLPTMAPAIIPATATTPAPTP